MEDSKVPFADTTARRAQLMAATEQFKSSITHSVDAIKGDATEVSKTTALVAGAALAVYLIVNAILPKSDEYRYAEKYGEPDDSDYDDEAAEEDEDHPHPSNRRAMKQPTHKTQRSAATSGLIGGILTSVLTNIAREQLTGFLARIRTNNAINPTAEPTQYHEQAAVEPVNYTSGS